MRILGRILWAFFAVIVVAAIWWLCQFPIVRNVIFALVGVIVVIDALLLVRPHHELHK